MTNRIFNLSNFITSLRLIGAIVILFLEPFTATFFIIYTICGLSDGIDGTIARMRGTVSEFGAKLDSVSDVLFYSIMIIKIFPYLLNTFTIWMWGIFILILLIRITIYVYVMLKYKKFASIHTYMNKIVGALVFCVPYIMIFEFRNILLVIILILAVISAIEECTIHMSTKEYQENTRTIFLIKKADHE